MILFRLGAQKPPDARRVTDDVVMRFDHIYEVDPAKMGIIAQSDMPAWDTLRIGGSRSDYLAWMHDHWADEVLAGEPLLADEPDGPDRG